MTALVHRKAGTCIRSSTRFEVDRLPRRDPRQVVSERQWTHGEFEPPEQALEVWKLPNSGPIPGQEAPDAGEGHDDFL